MVLPTVSWSDLLVLVTTLVMLAVPGVAVALAAGLRRWRLATAAPLLTVAVVGLSGPWSTALGLRWGPLVLGGATAVFAAATWALRRLLVTAEPAAPGPPWTPVAHAAVAGCVALAGAVGALGVLVGLGRLDAVLVGWDAGLHANAVRWIESTGNAGVYGVTQVNWYASAPRYYPNGYHLLDATAADLLPGAAVPSVLNATTVLTPVLFALGVAGLVHRFRGRAVTAGLAALVVVGAAPLVDLYYYGPLLPFALGLALLPGATCLVLDVLEARTWRRRILAAVILALAASALLVLHPGILVTAVLFALPAALATWWRGAAEIGASLLALVGAGLLTGLLGVVQIAGALSAASGPPFDWPAAMSPAEAIGKALLFEHGATTAQVWLALGFAIGLLSLYRAEHLRWLLAPVALFGSLFVIAASSDTAWSTAVTSPWWNDRWRLLAITAIGMCVLVAHGGAEVHRRLLVALASRLLRRRHGPTPRLISASVAAVVVLGLVVATNGLYLGASEARVRNSVGHGTVVTFPVVTDDERAGYAVLARLVPPGERVMNDNLDGSVWMYALDGVHPVFGHYDTTGVSPDQELLREGLDRYDVDPAVRAAAARLHVGWVVVGTGTVRGNDARAPGLIGLDRVRALRPVYSNPDVTIYRLLPDGPAVAGTP